MIGVVLITHGNLGAELVSVAEMVLGEQKSVKSIGVVDLEDDYQSMISSCIKELDNGDGVIILTDLFGGTPSNVALTFAGREGVEIISGASLPVLIDIMQSREKLKLHECAQKAVEAGRKQINLASDLLTG